jgi:hypothetical protein
MTPRGCTIAYASDEFNGAAKEVTRPIIRRLPSTVTKMFGANNFVTVHQDLGIGIDVRKEEGRSLN